MGTTQLKAAASAEAFQMAAKEAAVWSDGASLQCE